MSRCSTRRPGVTLGLEKEALRTVISGMDQDLAGARELLNIVSVS